MKPELIIHNHNVHLWQVNLSEFFSQTEELVKLLSPDEYERAYRFHFPQHQNRFIVARGMLRKILQLYLAIQPKEIIFSYSQRGKPYLKNNDLAFNLSHSEDFAVYAITMENMIGIDIQKIEKKYREGVAKRFFNEAENHSLLTFPDNTRAEMFYRLWASKEAIIKALGEGLYVPLEDFSIALDKKVQEVLLKHGSLEKKFYLVNLEIFPGFASALASEHEINNIIYYEWSLNGWHILPI